MLKIKELIPVYMDKFPPTEDMEEGVIYISREYEMASHLCACGCKGQTVTGLRPGHWTLTEIAGRVTLDPSIGNWSGENPYHAHYRLIENQVVEC